MAKEVLTMPKENINFDRPLSPREVADNFFGGQLAYGTVLDMAKSHEIPFHKIHGKYLIWTSELTAWLDILKGGDTNDRNTPV